MVAQQRHRFVVGGPQPLHEVDVGAFRDTEGGGDPGSGGLDPVAQDAGGGALTGRLQIVVQAAQFEGPLDLAVDDLGAHPAASHHQAFVDERLDGLADGGPGQAEPGRELDLVAEETAGGEAALFDGRLQLLRELVVERDRAAAVHTEFEGGGVGDGFGHGRSVALMSGPPVVRSSRRPVVLTIPLRRCDTTWDTRSRAGRRATWAG